MKERCVNLTDAEARAVAHGARCLIRPAHLIENEKGLRDRGAAIATHDGVYVSEKWRVGHHCLYHGDLRMRPEGDYTPDDVLKKQWYDSLFLKTKPVSWRPSMTATAW